jgi:hypothetical protein
VKRKDFQELAAIRLKEASILLEARCWEGAYYLGGYVIECALKSCIAKQTERHDFPDKDRTAASYTHDVDALLRLAMLDRPVIQTAQTDPKLSANWTVVRNWKERSRYSRPSQADAERLLNALSARRYGVLGWLKHRW